MHKGNTVTEVFNGGFKDGVDTKFFLVKKTLG